MSKDITINNQSAKLTDVVRTGDSVFIPTGKKVIIYLVIVTHRFIMKMMTLR